MRSFAVLFALAASALAYQVTEPTNATGWTTAGSNVVSWQKVNTDPANFTIVLVNQRVSPPTSQVLAALVDGSLGKTTVNPPSGGWKTGSGFQVNLVKDADNLNTILAQSGDFTIKAAVSNTSTTASGAATAGSGTLTVGAGSTATTGSSASATNGELNPSASQTGTSPTQGNGAASMSASTSLFVGLALLGAVLA